MTKRKGQRAGVPRPTDAELNILGVLWQRGPSTVREVHAALSARRPTGYTTVLKMLQIMTEKGLVGRDVEQRAHVYRALLRQEDAQRRLLGDLLERAFDGSASKLVMQVLSGTRASDAELAQIREMLDEFEGGDR